MVVEMEYNNIIFSSILFFFSLLLGFICCGQEYINSSTSLCCVGNDGYPTMHPAGNATVTLQCCGSKVIRQGEACCNGIGYDPQRHVCADRPTPGLLTQVSLKHFWCRRGFLSVLFLFNIWCNEEAYVIHLVQAVNLSISLVWNCFVKLIQSTFPL